jgi:pilus assembly protein CpaB
VLAIDQLADQRSDKPSVVKAVTLEVNVNDGEKVALAETVGTLSLLLSKAGEAADNTSHRVTTADLGQPAEPPTNSRFVTIGVSRPSKGTRMEYTVPTERGEGQSAALSRPAPVHD